MNEREISANAITAYCGTLLALGITPPHVRAYRYGGAWTVETADQQMHSAHRAVFRLADATARTIGLQTVSVIGEFWHLWQEDAALSDIAALAEALSEIHARADAYQATRLLARA